MWRRERRRSDRVCLFCKNGESVGCRLKESLENGDANLLQSEGVNEILQKKQTSWRRVAALAVIGGVSAPVSTACLAYFDTMRRDKLPQNVVVVRERKERMKDRRCGTFWRRAASNEPTARVE